MQRIERLLYVFAACLTVWAFAPQASATSPPESALAAAGPIPINCDDCHVVPIPDETHFYIYVGTGQGVADAWNALHDHFHTRYVQFIDCQREYCNVPELCKPEVNLTYTSLVVTATGEPFEYVAVFTNGEVHLCCTACHYNQ